MISSWGTEGVGDMKEVYEVGFDCSVPCVTEGNSRVAQCTKSQGGAVAAFDR